MLEYFLLGFWVLANVGVLFSKGHLIANTAATTAALVLTVFYIIEGDALWSGICGLFLGLNIMVLVLKEIVKGKK
jgi:hypothetical protein